MDPKVWANSRHVGDLHGYQGEGPLIGVAGLQALTLAMEGQVHRP